MRATRPAVAAAAVLGISLWIAGATAGATVTALASASCEGGPANGNSQEAAISRDGRFVAFYSTAANLVPGDTNGQHDAFIRDRLTGDVEILNVSSDEELGNHESAWPRPSGDGRFVAFHSLASNLVSDDENEKADVFVRDRLNGTTARVSVASDGSEANDHSGGQVITPDGRYVVFQTAASNLSPIDGAGWSMDVYLHDRQTGATELVSVAADGTRPNVFESQNPSVSDDGRYVVFESRAQLVAEDTDFEADVYLRDRVAETTVRISVGVGGADANSYNWIRLGHGISGDGRFIAFESQSTNLVDGDTNGWSDVFLHDRVDGTTSMLSTAPDGSPSDFLSAFASISGDGTQVAFVSHSSDLVSGDTNNIQDIFVRTLADGHIERVNLTETGDQFTVNTAGPSVSEDGSVIAYIAAPGTAYGGSDSFTDILVNAAIACPPPPTPEATPTPQVSPTPEITPAPSETPPAPSETPQPSPTPSPEPPGPDGPFVQAAGTSLTLNGEPYTFTGMNVYNANTRVHSCWYPFTRESLEDSFVTMGDGVDVIRAWFFQDFATVDGARSWTAFDETLDAAEATGKRVIVTLGNHWADCDAEGLKDADWYSGGYAERDPDLPASYRDYVAEVVTRYGHRSTVLMWQLLNEAEVPIHTPEGLCDEAATHPILASWAADVSALIKSIDPDHLVSIGTIGSGQCGAQYTDYKALHAIPTVDVCEFHDYGTAVMPGDQWNGLAFRIQQCAELGKPIFVGETGITPDWLDGTLNARADLFADKLATQMDAGVVGEVLWAWNAFESLTNTYDIGPGDPVLDVLASFERVDLDRDDDGVDDRIDVGVGAFDDGAGTTGSIVDTAGHDVTVSPETDGIRLAVSGSGTAKAVFSVCGFTLRLLPGSDAVISCGSISGQVVRGTMEIVLGNGLTVVSVPADVTAYVAETLDGGFVVEHRAGTAPIAVVVDGIGTSVAAGAALDVEAWDFNGFAAPVDAPPVLNVVKAGQSVPLKWRVLDGNGRPVTDLTTATVEVRALACTAGAPTDQLEQVGGGAAALQNLGNGYYQLNWKSQKAYGNSCRSIGLDIGDGVLHTAQFRFTK